MTNPANNELVQFLDNAINNSQYSVDEISIRAGYSNPAMVRMMLNGTPNIPINQVRRLAEAIGCPVEGLMLAALRTAFSENVMEDIELAVLSNQFGSPAAEYIRSIKTVTGGVLPEVTSNIRRRLRIAFGKL